jgi:hypothetical protein
MGARASIAVNAVVRRKRTPPTVDVEGIGQAQVGRLEVLAGDVALVRWIVHDKTGTHWHQELELVPMADLETVDVAN